MATDCYVCDADLCLLSTANFNCGVLIEIDDVYHLVSVFCRRFQYHIVLRILMDRIVEKAEVSTTWTFQ